MHLCLTKLMDDWKAFHRESYIISERLSALIELAKLAKDYKQTLSWMYRRVSATLRISERTLYRWARNYKIYGLYGIRPKKNIGKKPKPLAGWIAKYIKQMRDDYKWGAEVIQAHLREDFGIIIGQWRIHNFLKARGYIGRKTRKIKNKKQFKKILVFEPGDFTQFDIKHHPSILRNGKKSYVYNFVDHASKWQFKMAFEGYGAWETYRFMATALLKDHTAWTTKNCMKPYALAPYSTSIT
jgi:transposase